MLQGGVDKAIARARKVRRETPKQGTLDAFLSSSNDPSDTGSAKTCLTDAFAHITSSKYYGGDSIRNCCVHNFAINFKTCVLA